MRYSINNYVSALNEVLNGASAGQKDLAIKNFAELIIKSGDTARRDKIVEAVHRKVVNSSGGRWVSIESARELTGSKPQAIKKAFSEKDYVDFRVNSGLVAGVRITVNGEEEMDNSLQNKLKKLFK